MRRSLYVNLNRDGMKTLETDTNAFTTDGSFTIILENHGQPAHVHLHIDDNLARVASLEDPNWYVSAGEIEQVAVEVHDGVLGGGQLEISTGYGAERETVEVEVDSTETSEPTESSETETTSEPIDTGSSERDLSRLVIPGLFAAAGVLGAVVLMVLVSPTAAVMLGALALLVAIAAAGYLMVQN